MSALANTPSLDNPEPSSDRAGPLLGRSLAELSDWAEAWGQPRYRGKQVYDWLYDRGARSFDEMLVLPKQWRQDLAAGATIGRSQVRHCQRTQDGTQKFLLELADGNLIETVGIPTAQRLTACVSTQVGCPMACDFCATGKGGFTRNLERHEIVDQVLAVREGMGQRVSHIVFMGMGEPLLNFENLVGAIAVLNRDLGIGQRHITVSTVGVPERIPQLAAHHLQVTLAVSLHAPNPELRAQLIPSARVYPLDRLMADCREYVEVVGRRISFEYTLLAGVNDAPEHARQLARLLRGFQSHVNLIPYNPISEADYQRPAPHTMQQFLQRLKEEGIAASLRRTRGLDGEAACGQLRGEHWRRDRLLAKRAGAIDLDGGRVDGEASSSEIAAPAHEDGA